MSRVLLGVVLGLILGTTVYGEEQTIELRDAVMEGVGRGSFVVPKEYGELVHVAVSSEIHHLYFQDAEGRIRILQLGRRGAVQRARAPLQLLSSDASLIERKRSEDPTPAEPY